MNKEEYIEAERLLDIIYDDGYGKEYAVETLLKLIKKEREEEQ